VLTVTLMKQASCRQLG